MIRRINQRKFRSHRFRNSLIALAALLLILAAVVGYQTYHVYQSELPSFAQLHNIEPSLKTKVYDRDSVLLKEFYTENRVLTPFKDMPPILIDMLLASEDQEFYDHWGINLRRVAIVAASNVLRWRRAAGASTITQQLARMLFLHRQKTFERKIKEALTAIKLERTYSKNEILEMYLNQYYFSRGAYGVAAAAHLFFSKEVSELDILDCALLVGLVKAPNTNSPFSDSTKALAARNRVLSSYFHWGRMTKSMFDSLSAEPLHINPPREEIGAAPYFTETVRQYILDKYGEDVLYSGGLEVYTSLSADLQRAAEEAVYRKVDTLRDMISRRYDLGNTAYTKLVPDTTTEDPTDSVRTYKVIEGALVAIDNSNGDVLALVGGRSFEQSKWNHAVQAPLQPGSAFKPFIYTACIDNGFRTTEIIDDNPVVLEIPGAPEWRPHNYDYKFWGPMTLREGIQWSRNLVAVKLLLRITPEQAVFYAHKMGISTELRPYPTLAMGTSEVKLVELVSAYSVFPNKGIHIPYRTVLRIVDRYGRVLEDNRAVQKEEVLSAQTAYIMVDLMRSVVKEGTGRRTQWMGFTRPAGGKTGTSDNWTDAWFVGYTPQITAGCWVGFTEDRTSLGVGMDGGSVGVPIWTEFMLAAHDSLPVEDFQEPEGIVRREVCLESGELATDRCMKVREEIFTVDNQPTAECHLHPTTGTHILTRPLDTAPTGPEDDSDRVHF